MVQLNATTNQGVPLVAKMIRPLQLKKIVPIDGKKFPAISPLDIHVKMDQVFKKAVTVGDRHVPVQTSVAVGKRCIFLERVNRPGKAVMFNAYIYVNGHTPDQVVTDFTAVSANINAQKIVDSSGKTVEVVQRVACLVLGEAMIVENARVYAAAPLLLAAMRELVRRHVDPKFPNLHLEDAPNRNFKKLAVAHGGVKKVVARLGSQFTPEPASYGAAMESFFKINKFSKFKQVTTSIEVEDGQTIDLDKVEELIDESEGNTGLSGISVQFGDGDSLSDLETYRERHRLEVTEVRAGVPAINEVQDGIVEYLRSLVKPGAKSIQIIDADGNFV